MPGKVVIPEPCLYRTENGHRFPDLFIPLIVELPGHLWAFQRPLKRVTLFGSVGLWASCPFEVKCVLQAVRKLRVLGNNAFHWLCDVIPFQ